jgi:hypothetical protein
VYLDERNSELFLFLFNSIPIKSYIRIIGLINGDQLYHPNTKKTNKQLQTSETNDKCNTCTHLGRRAQLDEKPKIRDLKQNIQKMVLILKKHGESWNARDTP